MLAAPTADQATTSRLVYGLLSDSRYAYRPRALDDALSQDILKRYLETLDGGKVFFTAQDIAGFERYKTTLDDAIKSGDVAPAWAVFAVYRQRVNERITQARSLLKGNFDFTTDEQYQYDREDAPWAASSDVLDILWRQSVKNDWLRLKLAGKKPDEIRKTLDKRYANVLDSVSEIKGDDVFQSFINAYAGAIDPHTDYLNPRSAENFNLTMSNSLEGIGAVLQKQDDVVLIREIVPGGPASRSSLKPGDRITAVGQGSSGEMKDIIGWRIDDAVQLIRGAADSQVRLDVIAAAAPMDSKPERLLLTRAKVRLEDQAAKAETIIVPASEGQPVRRIGVIKLPGFYQDFDARRRGDGNYASATRDIARLLAQFRVQKMDGVVLDLRNNGGGSLSEAIELTGLFIDQGPVVQVRESSGRVSVEDDRKPGVAWTGPLAVLVNRGSASASEIVAGAIQDYGRGLIIGETTFGKGTVQNMVDLDRWPANEKPRFGQVKLTIAQFFRPGGSSTQNKGVVPDVDLPDQRGCQRVRREQVRQCVAVDADRGGAARAVRQLCNRCWASSMRVTMRAWPRTSSSSGSQRMWRRSASSRPRSRCRSTRPCAAPSATSSMLCASACGTAGATWVSSWTRCCNRFPMTACRQANATWRRMPRVTRRPRSAPIRCCANPRRSWVMRLACSVRMPSLSAQVLPESRSAGHWVD